MDRNGKELQHIALGAALCLCTVVAQPVLPAQTAAGLLLALYLPGRALIPALLPARVTRTEEAAVACGLSICVTILGGFVLHFLNAMSLIGWAAFLAGTTIAICIFLQRANIVACLGRREQTLWALLSRKDRVSLATIGILVLLSFTIASAGQQSYMFFKYTEFWITPGTVPPRSVSIGVRNREGISQTFIVELHSERELVARWTGIRVDPDETWTKRVPLAAVSATGSRLEARLFRADATGQLYRRVWLAHF